MDPSFSEAMSVSRTKVVIVDDHASIRQMLSVILGLEMDFLVVGEASGGIEGLRLCRSLRPEIVILDLALPELAGIHLIRLLRIQPAPPRIVVYTGALDDDTLREALDLEPEAFVRKEDSLPDLRFALCTVARSGRYISPASGRFLRTKLRRAENSLTAQETAVLQMIAEGRQSKEMAEALCAAPKTIEHHRQNLMNKLDIHDVASLTRFAVRMRLVSVSS